MSDCRMNASITVQVRQQLKLAGGSSPVLVLIGRLAWQAEASTQAGL